MKNKMLHIICYHEKLYKFVREKEREGALVAYLVEGREGEEKGASSSLEYSIVWKTNGTICVWKGVIDALYIYIRKK